MFQTFPPQIFCIFFQKKRPDQHGGFDGGEHHQHQHEQQQQQSPVKQQNHSPSKQHIQNSPFKKAQPKQANSPLKKVNKQASPVKQKHQSPVKDRHPK